MHLYLPQNGGSVRDAEVVAFIAANLAFGRREQILLHVQWILDRISAAHKTPSEWILSGEYAEVFPPEQKSFYRMYTFSDLRVFFDNLKSFLTEERTLGEYFQKKYERALNENAEKSDDGGVFLHRVIAQSFKGKCALISRSPGSAAKKLNMLLRWLVRTDSPVDLGLWTWYDRSKLLMPLDTHVMQESVKYGLLKKNGAGKIPSASLKTAVELTRTMQKIFPGDPVRGDYALFGLGTDTGK